MDLNWKRLLNTELASAEGESSSQVLQAFQYIFFYPTGSSLLTQLNMYGFRKVKEGNRQFYMHINFKRGKPELSAKISRRPEKKFVNFQDSLKNTEKES